MSDKVFWYEKNSEKHGGFTASELKALALSGEIDSSCLIWKEGAKNWIPAASVKGLLPPEPTPAPPPDSISPINEPPPEVEHEPTNESPKKNSIMKNSGFVLAFIAAICIVSALTMDTSVATVSGSRVNNIGLMSLQTNLLIGGGFAFISAIVLILFSSKFELSNTNKKCPYCAEIIKREAAICRYCGKEQERSLILEVNSNNKKPIKNKWSRGLFVLLIIIVINYGVKINNIRNYSPEYQENLIAANYYIRYPSELKKICDTHGLNEAGNSLMIEEWKNKNKNDINEVNQITRDFVSNTIITEDYLEKKIADFTLEVKKQSGEKEDDYKLSCRYFEAKIHDNLLKKSIEILRKLKP